MSDTEDKILQEMIELGTEYEQVHGDHELNHHTADGLLCQLLTHLGYEDIVKAFDNVYKWYA